jgi:hypothetical protein
MGLARLHKAGALLVVSLLLVLTGATGVHSACHATCKRDIARCMATQCDGMGQETCRRRCEPGLQQTDQIAQDQVTKAVVFASSCDPLGTNPFGSQIFSMRPDGSALRQLTDAAGFTSNPDGSIRVELPGPFAYSGARP